uniref:Macaca fascicularis brain cDNA, clone: QtrA-16624 n=1 Tax=Macaca fascicularis TaxID=9541 RepID=I7GKP6_MACFA|nr:unnamed protein product [Macaca fascicularis]
MPKIFKEIHIIYFKMIYQCYLPKEIILFFPFGKILSSNVRIRSLDSVSTCTIKLNLEPELGLFLCLSFSTCKQFPIKIV